MKKNINLFFVLFIGSLLLYYNHLNLLYYGIYIVSFLYIVCIISLKKQNENHIIFDKKILVLFCCFIIIGILSSILNIVLNGTYIFDKYKFDYFKLYLDYFIVILVYMYVYVYNTKFIKSFYLNLLYFVDIFNIINIYELITKKSLFYTYILGESKNYFIDSFETINFRTFSIFVHPIVYSVILVCLFWCNYYVPRKNRFIVLISQLLIVINLFFTKSRSGWISLVLTLIIFFISTLKNKNIIKRKINININMNKIVKCIFIVSIIVLIGYIFRVQLGTIIDSAVDSIYSRIITSTDDSFNDISRLQRLGTIELINNHMTNDGILNFLFGGGYKSATEFMSSNTVSIASFGTTDNQFITIFFQYGVLGIGVYLMIILKVLIDIMKENNKTIWNLNRYMFLTLNISMFFFEGMDWSCILLLILFSLSLISIKKISINGNYE